MEVQNELDKCDFFTFTQRQKHLISYVKVIVALDEMSACGNLKLYFANSLSMFNFSKVKLIGQHE